MNMDLWNLEIPDFCFYFACHSNFLVPELNNNSFGGLYIKTWLLLTHQAAVSGMLLYYVVLFFSSKSLLRLVSISK